jgi:hypothetical protein
MIGDGNSQIQDGTRGDCGDFSDVMSFEEKLEI